MQLIALIPARSGSKSIKDKNIQPIADFPLLVWSIAVAQMIGLEVYVSTDSEQYASIARKYHAQVVMRPEELAQDTSEDIEYLQHFLTQVSCELIVLLRPTTPLRDSTIVKKAIKGFEPENYSALRSAHKTAETACKYYKFDRKGMFVNLFRFQGEEENRPRQLLPKTFAPNGYVDIIKASIIGQGKVYGDKIQPFLTSDPIEIDDMMHLEIARLFAERRGENLLFYLRKNYDSI